MPLCNSKRRQSAGRTRSLSGCGTCRTRHTKCDETRPSCHVCVSAGLLCEGYDIRLVFDGGDAQGSRCRRPLYTLQTRQQMSAQLAASVDPQDVDRYLCRMDEECEEPEEEVNRSFVATFGPFGAFRVSDPLPLSSAPTEPASHHELDVVTAVPPNLSGSPVALLTDHVPSTEIDDPLMECLFWDVDAPADLLNGGFFSTSLYPSGHPGNGQLASPDISLSDNVGILMNSPTLNGPSSSLLPPPIHILAPDDANFLLSHYRSTVIRFFSPIYSRKTPWQIMHVPNAMETLGQLAMGELAPNARMCIFYAILAISAFTLRVSSSQGGYEHWQRRADMYAGHAQTYLKLAFQDVSSASTKVKYKDMLMALLCMATVSAYQGSETRIESCLLDCEHWISLRGLPKTRKSRKVRLLHHCYVQLRVFHESTSISRKPDSPFNTRAGRFFRVQRWEARFNQRMSDPKEGLLAENDLHLEVPGRMKSTMYPLIYGIPENLLFLLAQTTRLANEKDLLDSTGNANGLEMQQFWARARSLEGYICCWRPSPSLEQDGEMQVSDIDQESLNNNSTEPQEHEIIKHYVFALHRALLIFFYRRIHDIHPTILQDQVRQIKDSLSRCDEFDIPAVRLAAGFVWLAFIASCEALDPLLQDWFCRWFDVSAERSGLLIFQIAKNTAMQAWKRDKTAMSASWPQILRDNNQNIFYI